METSSQSGSGFSDRIRRMTDEEIVQLNLHHMSDEDAARFGLEERFKKIKEAEAERGNSVGRVAYEWVIAKLQEVFGIENGDHPKKPSGSSDNKAA